MRLLVVTAVETERGAVLAGSAMHDVVAVAGGVGVAAAAATTARLLATADPPFTAVLAAGIGGGFPGRVPVGGLAVAERIIAADLGADSPDGFLPLDRLGFGATALDADPALLAWLRKTLPDAVVGPVLTVSTVTGTTAGTAAILARYPDAVSEAMEGFGVATAAAQAGLPFGELRAISNLIGPRNRQAWRIGAALAALTEAFTALSRYTQRARTN